MYTLLKKIEKEYLKEFQFALDSGRALSAELLVEISVSLFNKWKIKRISDSDNPDNDMLLFEYGIYDWHDERGKHFSFDITRQFIKPKENEPYQLRFELMYEPEQFEGLAPYECWSMDFTDIDYFFTHIKESKGFKMAMQHKPKSHNLSFYQV